MDRIANIALKISNLFTKNAEILAQDTKFKQRKSKLLPGSFLTSYIFGHLIHPKPSLEDICSLLLHNFKIKISKQGLEQRFNNNCVDYFRSTFNYMLNSLIENNFTKADILKQFTNVVLLDSSIISLPACMSAIFPGFGGTSSAAALRMQTLFDWTNDEIKHVEFAAATKNDQGYKGHLEHIDKGALLIQDLGYFDINSFKNIIDNGSYFLSRFRGKINTYRIEPSNNDKYEPFDVVSYLEQHNNGDIVSFSARIGATLHLPVRFIARPVPFEVYKERLRKAKREKKQNNLSEKTKYLLRWTIFITNISENMIDNKAIFILYKIRWQIELLFKLMKSQAGIDRVAARKEPRILCDIYARLLLVVLVIYLARPSNYCAQEVSLTKAFNRLRNYGAELIKSVGSYYLMKKLIKKIDTVFSTLAIKEHKRKRKTTMQLLGAVL